MKKKPEHLNRYYHFTQLMRDPEVKLLLLRYKSEFDHSMQSLLILEPVHRKTDKLFFFFHGMDGDCGDGVVVKDVAKHLNAKVVCLGGRGPSWVSDAFLTDAQQVINTYLKGFDHFYLLGISMGATQALSLAGLLPKKLQHFLKGVIAIIPGTNLLRIVHKSTHQRVKDTLINSVGGNIALLKERSPHNLIKRYKKNLPFALFLNENDTILLSEQTTSFIYKLNRTHSVNMFSVSGEHDFTFQNFNYEKIFQGLGRVSLERKTPPLYT